MDKGKIIEEGSPLTLIQKHIGEEVLEVDYDENTLKALKKKMPEARIEILSDRIHVFTSQPHGVFERFLENSATKGATIRQANLEDVFLKLTGRGLRE